MKPSAVQKHYLELMSAGWALRVIRIRGGRKLGKLVPSAAQVPETIVSSASVTAMIEAGWIEMAANNAAAATYRLTNEGGAIAAAS